MRVVLQIAHTTAWCMRYLGCDFVSGIHLRAPAPGDSLLLGDGNPRMRVGGDALRHAVVPIRGADFHPPWLHLERDHVGSD